MTALEASLPTCGTCPFALAAENEADRWCHGAPPTAAVDGSTSAYPPVGADKVGCALHPDWPRKRWWWPW